MVEQLRQQSEIASLPTRARLRCAFFGPRRLLKVECGRRPFAKSGRGGGGRMGRSFYGLDGPGPFGAVNGRNVHCERRLVLLLLRFQNSANACDHIFHAVTARRRIGGLGMRLQRRRASRRFPALTLYGVANGRLRASGGGGFGLRRAVRLRRPLLRLGR